MRDALYSTVLEGIVKYLIATPRHLAMSTRELQSFPQMMTTRAECTSSLMDLLGPASMIDAHFLKEFNQYVASAKVRNPTICVSTTIEQLFLSDERSSYPMVLETLSGNSSTRRRPSCVFNHLYAISTYIPYSMSFRTDYE